MESFAEDVNLCHGHKVSVKEVERFLEDMNLFPLNMNASTGGGVGQS